MQSIENLLRCPGEGCFKTFRNKAQLHMHTKHYHKELKNMMGAIPVPLDDAYARTMPVEKETACSEKDKELPRPSKREKPKPPVTEPNPPIKKPKTPLKASKPPVKKSKPPVKEPKPPVKKPKSSAKESKPTVKEPKPPVKEPKLPVKKSKPPVKEPKPPVKKPESTAKQFKPTVKEPKLPVKKSKPPVKDPKAPVKDPEIKELETELKVDTGPITPVKDGDSIPVARSQDSPKLQQATINKLVKQASVLLPVGTPEQPEPVMLDPVNEELADSESAITTHTVVKQVFDKKRKGKKQRKTTALAAKVPGSRNGEKRKVVHMKREDIINCHCGYRVIKGLMLQCDLCLFWQHAICQNLQQKCKVPEKYNCSICLNPCRGRRSQRFLNDQECMYEGRLPGGTPSDLLRRSHELIADLLRIRSEIHGLKVQHYIITKKDYPWFTLSAKEKQRIDNQLRHNIPEQAAQHNGNAAAQPVPPRMNRRQLTEHMKRCRTDFNNRIDTIEANIEELEFGAFGNEEPVDVWRIKQTIQMMLRDLDSMEDLANII